MRKELKPIPKFKSEEEERGFWAKADTSEYFDLQKGEEVLFPQLKPATESISLRLPRYLLAQIKALANSRDIPYQSFLKMLLTERVQNELALLRSSGHVLDRAKKSVTHKV